MIEKPYEPLARPRRAGMLVGRESQSPASLLDGDPWLEVRSLVPDDPAFDFRVTR